MPTERPELSVGGRVREYQILEQIGRGGMGAVYRARHVYLDEERAIKVVHPDPIEGVNLGDRFIREARILVKLRHPNLVQLHEFGTLEDGSFFMVMELIRGESVLQRIGLMGRIPIDAAINIAREAALGLGAAHAQGIIHRDISPDNLLLVKLESAREITKIIDFGIAKPVAEEAKSHTLSTGVFVGKPQYCSPEQCGLLEPGETIDHRSDIYSLGVTFYHMLTGKLPFYASTPQGYLLKHASEAPQPPSTHFPPDQFPPELDALILKSLAKRRSDRQASMDEFLRELEEISNQRSPESTRAVERGTSSEASGPNPGTIFAGRFNIDRELGRGGMGTVYKATDRILGIPIAIKIMNARIASSPTSLERLKREVILARKVAHPNVCRIFDIGEFRGTHFVTMEYVEGKTLSSLLRAEGKLSVDLGIPIVRQLLRGLQEAHRAGVIHRDLKPQNIMVDPNNHVYIMDFGLSITSGAERLTQVGAVVGTPMYMAPEQHEEREIDQRADLYAIGVIMFEIFTGRAPFRGDNAIQVLLAHMNTPPPAPTSIVPDLPVELERVILKLLQKKPLERYPSAADLLQALEMLGVPSETSEVNREAMVHRMMVERRFSQAVRLLSAMMQTDPGNPRWKKLLQTALTEKALRDVRRARRLMKEGRLELVPAILKSLSGLVVQSPKANTQIARLREEYGKEVEGALLSILRDVDAHLAGGDPEGADSRLKDASRLQPEDPRVAGLLERIKAERKVRVRRRREGRVEEARGLRATGREDDALALIAEVLQSDAEFQPAEVLREQILQARAVREVELKLRESARRIVQGLVEGEFEKAYADAQDAVGRSAGHPLQPGLSRLASAVQAIWDAIYRQDFAAAADRVHRVVSEDREGLLTEDRRQLDAFESRARETQAERERHRERVASGRRFQEEMRWEEAIEAWQQAQQAFPSDPEAGKLIVALELSLQKEQRVRAQVQVQLADGERLLASGNDPGARKVIDSVQQGLLSEPRLQDLKQRAAALAQRVVDTERERQRADDLRRQEEETARQARLDRYHRAMEEGARATAARQWDQAGRAFQNALQEQPQSADAQRQLAEAREAAARAGRLTAQFQKHVAGAEAAVRDRRWDDAIALCEIALGKEYAGARSEAAERSLLANVERSRAGRVEDTLKAARVAMASGALDRAREMCARALTLDPANGPARQLLEEIERAKAPPLPPPQAPIVPVEVLPQAAPPPDARNRLILPAALALIGVCLLIVLYIALHRGPGPEPQPPIGPVEGPIQTTLQTAAVSVDAMPWARVSLTPLTSGLPVPQVAEEEMTTPCSLTLPVGEYSVELSNSAFAAPLKTTIRVSAGGPNVFVFKMPGFDARSLAKEWSHQQ